MNYKVAPLAGGRGLKSLLTSVPSHSYSSPPLAGGVD